METLGAFSQARKCLGGSLDFEKGLDERKLCSSRLPSTISNQKSHLSDLSIGMSLAGRLLVHRLTVRPCTHLHSLSMKTS